MKNTTAENRRLREQFAAAALMGLLARDRREYEEGEYERSQLAISAWGYADEMMKLNK